MFNTKGAAVVVVIMAHGSCVLGRVCVFHTFLAAGGKISEAVFIRPRTTNPVERGPTRPTTGTGAFGVCGRVWDCGCPCVRSVHECLRAPSGLPGSRCATWRSVVRGGGTTNPLIGYVYIHAFQT